MNWFANHRQEWIKESLYIFGQINRAHIARKFNISSMQASNDLRDAQARWPDLMQYDRSEKAYRLRCPPPTPTVEDSGDM